MAKPAARIFFLEGSLALVAGVLLVRGFSVQVIHHRYWANQAEERRTVDVRLPARRGRILDRNGHVLAVSEEQYRISISLNEVRDTAALERALPRRLGIPAARVAAEFRNDYPYFYGPFGAEQVDSLRNVRGVHLTVLYNRVYPMQSLADRVIGRLNEDGTAGIEGLEKSLDTLLRGEPGLERDLVDVHGNHLELPGAPAIAPRPGHDVYLTIDDALQDIAEGALRQAVDSNRARGGDVVILDLRSGEFLAVASLRIDSATGRLVSTPSAFVEPNEPGSTSKLFTLAALLRTGTDTTPVEGHDGVYAMPVGANRTRTIRDVERINGPVTPGETVQESSNIAISQFAIRLSPAEQYTAIRDFGFGMPLLVGFPGEAAGVLRHPSEWENRLYSQPSLGMGYEWEATAAQLAVGYGAIGNHGVLLVPALVREVRDDHGAITWAHRPDTVRRAVPDSVARQLMAYLALVTDTGGTGVSAQLDRFKVVGKTGTADVKGGGYRSSFVGIFPGDDPQAVIYVMIDRPSAGEIYGGKVAAPVVRTVLQQALGTPTSPLDRSRLNATIAVLPEEPPPPPEAASLERVALPLPAHPAPPAPVVIPDLAGLDLRRAIAALNRAGLEVRLVGRDQVRGTQPVAGDTVPRGSTVTLVADSTW